MEILDLEEIPLKNKGKGRILPLPSWIMEKSKVKILLLYISLKVANSISPNFSRLSFSLGSVSNSNSSSLG